MNRVPYDNWTLSTEKAVAVLKYMFEVNLTLADPTYAKYFAATGYSEFKPITEGTDEESLRKNRRISFQIILDDEKWQKQLGQFIKNKSVSNWQNWPSFTYRLVKKGCYLLEYKKLAN